MEKIQNKDIHIINRHSNWSKDSIDNLLKKEIYNSKEAWQQFLRLFFISLGIGFTTAGILFFFAYNWANLHKFIKIGLIEFMIITTIAVVLFSKINLDIKNILLTGASILVGVLFAVFGQIYQTGANAYDFFLGWTLSIAIWVAVSNFAALWLVFIILINTTFILYTEQIAHNWSSSIILTLLFSINSLFLLVALFGKSFIPKMNPPTWFSNILALAVVSFSTIGISEGIHNDFETAFGILCFASALLYFLGFLYSLKIKSSFYIAIIAFSIICIITSFLIKLSDDAGMFLFISIFLVASITLVIKTLIELQKKWTK